MLSVWKHFFVCFFSLSQKRQMHCLAKKEKGKTGLSMCFLTDLNLSKNIVLISIYQFILEHPNILISEAAIVQATVKTYRLYKCLCCNDLAI